jgi:hypothetical protein
MANKQGKPRTEAPGPRDEADNLDREPVSSTDTDVEREQIRSSNDPKLEREKVTPKQDRGSDQTVHGQRGPTDPDSAESDIDRDDTVTD